MFKKIKSLLTKRITLILWLFSFAYTLPVYDKYWAPFDEGIIVVAAQKLLAGEIPYKDFFIVMYPPGQIYILSALFTLFLSSLLAARLYTVLVSIVISMLVFFISRMLTGNLMISIFSWLMVLTSLAPRLGAIPNPIWPGMLFSILSIYIFMRYLRNLKVSSIILSGLAAGAAVAFRHDIGIFASLAVLLPLSAQGLAKRHFKNIIFFISSILSITAPWVLYFITKSASRDIFNSLIAFTFIHARTAALPFPRPCLDLNMIFHGSLHFINVNQFCIPIITYSCIFAFLLARIFRRSWHSNEENLSILSILLFGIFTFSQVRIRADIAHLLTVIEPAVILSGFLLHNTLSSGFKFNKFKLKYLIRYPVLLLIFILIVLLLIKNIDKYMKNTYIKVYRKDIVKTRFDKGSVYLPKEESEDVSNTLKFIKENTKASDRIYIGNMMHWKDDFGGSTIIYFLADRLPSTKFYELLPGLITDREVQIEIRDSLKMKDVKLIVLQDVETGGLKRLGAPEDHFILDDFIQRNYKVIARFGKYNIYNKISK